MSTGQLLREGAAGARKGEKGLRRGKVTIGRQAASLEENIRGNIKGRGGVAVNGVLEESVVYV